MSNKILRAKFYYPDEDRYIYRKILIAPSNIPNAGLGAFAMEPIPKGAISKYRGLRKIKMPIYCIVGYVIPIMK